MQPKTKKIIKITAIVLASILLFTVLLVGGYVTYVIAQYYRIEDGISLDVSNGQTQKVERNKQYSLLTYNLGFGAYSPEYSFFMDEGIMKDGTKTVGTYAKGLSKEDVAKNVNGQIGVLKREQADFCFLQEVDTDSDRSYHINMLSEITTPLTSYGYTIAMNFHTANLLYPFNDPIGKSQSGIVTLSRYQVTSATRRSFPVTTALIDKLFDLDRCFAVHVLPIEGSEKSLVLINLHMSAYDEGGVIRTEQLKMLNKVLSEEREKGNYVIAGGDFNHCLIADLFGSDEEALAYFKSEQLTPDWVKSSILHQKKDVAEGFQISAPINASTCRGADMPYEKDVTFCTVIDGFIVSDNIQVISKNTVEIEYAYSDHNPVKLEFVLE